MLNNRCALKAIAYDLCEENHELKRTAKKLIEKITVFANHFTVEFKSGITIEIES